MRNVYFLNIYITHLVDGSRKNRALDVEKKNQLVYKLSLSVIKINCIPYILNIHNLHFIRFSNTTKNSKVGQKKNKNLLRPYLLCKLLRFTTNDNCKVNHQDK